MKGRKPTPTVLRILRGNPGHRPINTSEPDTHPLPTACPKELTDAAAVAEWKRMIVPAIETGHITLADRTMAIAHCELFATWQAQIVEARQHPFITAAGKNEYPMPTPVRTMAMKTLLLLARIDSELGFTPSSRSRVHLKKPGAVSPTSPVAHQKAKYS